ncbi:unnamed protein product [Penicillium discolor]
MDMSGRLLSEDPGVNADAWARELPGESLSPVLAARALLVEDPVGSPLSGETLALPHYVGLHQSVLRLPATWAAIRRSVSGADLVLVKVPGVLGTLATLAARRRGIPVAAEVVGDAEGVLRSGALGTAGRLLRPVVGVVTRFVVRRAGAVRYVTERELQRRYPPAPDAAVASFSDVVIADEPSWEGAEGGAPHLVSVGSVDQLYKGHHHLIEALGRIRDEFPNATLTIVGSGRRMPFLYETAREHGVSDAVRFTGYLGDPADVAAVLAEATLTGVRRRIARAHSTGDDRGGGLRAAYRTAARALLPFSATHVAGVSDAALRFLVGRWGRLHRWLGVDNRVLVNGVDVGRFHATGEEQDVRPPRVVHVGRASPEKNRRVLVPIFRALRAMKPVRCGWSVPAGRRISASCPVTEGSVSWAWSTTRHRSSGRPTSCCCPRSGKGFLASCWRPWPAAFPWSPPISRPSVSSRRSPACFSSPRTPPSPNGRPRWPERWT